MHPSISVAMATWNGRPTSPSSWKAWPQERLPTELVVCDDGSPTTLGFSRNSPAGALRGSTVSRNRAQSRSPQRPSRRRSRSARATYLPVRPGRLLGAGEDPPSRRDLRARSAHDGRPQRQVDRRREAQPVRRRRCSATCAALGTPDVSFIAGCCSAYRREWLPVALPVPGGSALSRLVDSGLAHQLGVSRILDEPLQLYRRHGQRLGTSPLCRTGRLPLGSAGGQLGAFSSRQRR